MALHSCRRANTTSSTAVPDTQLPCSSGMHRMGSHHERGSVLTTILSSGSAHTSGTRARPIAIPSESGTSGEETDSAPIDVSIVQCEGKKSDSDSDGTISSTAAQASTNVSEDDDVDDVDAVQPEKGLKQLQSMFPQLPTKALAVIYTECRENVEDSIECLLSGPTFEWLRDLLATKLSSETKCLKIDPEDVFSTAYAYYKRESFDPRVPLSIQFEGQPAIDAGGPRRHFFSQFLKEFATLPSLNLFEGPSNYLRPKYTPQNVVTGMFKTLGKILSHSLVLEGIGFPYLSPV